MDHLNLFPVTLYLRNLLVGATGPENAGGSDSDLLASAQLQPVTIVLTSLPILISIPLSRSTSSAASARRGQGLVRITQRRGPADPLKQSPDSANLCPYPGRDWPCRDQSRLQPRSHEKELRMYQPIRRRALVATGALAILASLALAACTKDDNKPDDLAANRVGAMADYGLGKQFKATEPLSSPCSTWPTRPTRTRTTGCSGRSCRS